MTIILPMDRQRFIGVQSLGRHDITAPLRTAQAVTNSMFAVGAAVGKWEEAELKKNVSRGKVQYQREIGALNRTLSSPSIDPDGFDLEPGIDYDEKDLIVKKDKDGNVVSKSIATWKVGTDIFDKQELKIRIGIEDNIGTTIGIDAFRSDVEGFHQQSVSTVIARRFNGQAASLRGEFQIAYNGAVANGNEVDAIAIINDAVTTGSWSIEEGEAKMASVGSQIDQASIMDDYRLSLRAHDVQGLESVIRRIIEPDGNRLTSTQRTELMTKVNTGLLAMDKKNSKDAKKIANEGSQRMLNTFTHQIRSDGPMGWEEVARLSGVLSPDHYEDLMALNAAKIKEPKSSDPDTLSSIHIRIMGLTIPVPGVGRSDRAITIREELRAELGYDPVTGESTGNPTITTDDYLELIDLIDKQVARKPGGERYDEVEDHIYRIILKAGKKDIFAKYSDSDGKTQARLVKWVRKYQGDADAAGDTFDPNAWFDSNKKAIILDGDGPPKKVVTLDSYMIRDKKGEIDFTRTEAKMKEAYEKKTLGYYDYSVILEDLYDIKEER